MTLTDIVNLFRTIQALPRKTSLDKLVAQKSAQMDKKNSEVLIRDILVRPIIKSDGEVHTGGSEQSPIKRLTEHIHILFNLANEDHRSTNCESIQGDQFKIKEGQENNITRLSTPEFSFYTNQPLTMEQFIALYNDLLQSPSFILEPNVHILLSSFAVKDQQDNIFNISLFIEGGHPIIIHAFSKNSASANDVAYGDIQKIFSQQHIVTPEKITSTGPTADFIGSEDGAIINTASVFDIETKGGARYTQAIDVCLDHALRHSERQMAKRILGTTFETEFIPEQIEHCITSNSIRPNYFSLFSEQLLHVDPNHSMVCSFDYVYGVGLDKKNIPIEALNTIISPESKTKIIKEEYRYILQSPPFGFDCQVEYLKARAAGHFLPNILKPLETHNQETMRKLLKTHQHESGEINSIAINLSLQQGVIREHLERNSARLKTELRSLYTPTETERMFQDNEYMMKTHAQKIISAQLRKIELGLQEKQDAALLIFETWHKNFEAALDHAFEKPTELQKAFLIRLKKAITQHLIINTSHDLSPLFRVKKTLPSISRKSHFSDDSSIKLNQAVSSGDIEKVIEILDEGVDVNEYSLHIISKPLYIACRNNHIPIMRCLLESGADSDFLDPHQNNAPLHIAAMMGHLEAVTLLLDNRAFQDIKDGRLENTPLHFAVNSDRENVVDTLLKIGKANPNLQNKLGNTALHDAVKKGNLNIVHLLLEHGANPEEENISSETPLELAMNTDNPEILEALLRKIIPAPRLHH